MNDFQTIVCIGTSTGGPGALEKVLTRLPWDFAAPLFIVQHMPPKFTEQLAKRLDSLSQITVKEAEHGERAKAGTAYIARGGFHLNVVKEAGGLSVQLDDSEPKGVHCPSVNRLFESAAKLKGYGKVAVIMTGMGSDGAEGLRLLKKSGNTYAIAESEASSIVFGMPRAAADTGEVDLVLPACGVAECLVNRLTTT